MIAELTQARGRIRARDANQLETHAITLDHFALDYARAPTQLAPVARNKSKISALLPYFLVGIWGTGRKHKCIG
jgi:hypothetical protein